MPHRLYRNTGAGGRFADVREGDEHWLVPLDNTQRSGALHPGNPQPPEYLDTGDTCTDAELIHVANARRGQAEQLRDRYNRGDVAFQPLTVPQIATILEAEFLAALVQNPQDATRVGVARRKLVGFWQRQQGNYVQAAYRYSLEDNFVGETAHIHAAWKLKPDAVTVHYRCTSNPVSQRFTTFMAGVPVAGGAAAANDAKTHINEFLIAPRTAGRSPDAHEEVLRAFVAGITPARRNEIRQWVAQQFQGHLAQPNRRRVAIWVRNVNGGGHAADQNMSRTRFRKILDAVHAAGVEDVILVGDGLPAADWTQHPNGHPHYAANGAHRIYDFSQIWSGAGPLPAGQHSAPATLRGYAEQLAVYASLYRNPDAQSHINMLCIITNKSGGPDLPSLAGIPQIQIAEMAAPELMIHHRMGFQALCSHAWTVLRSPQRDHGVEQDLSGAQVQELTGLVNRAGRLRTWHLDRLGQRRFTWTG